MTFRLALVWGVILLGLVLVPPALAQESPQLRYIDELKQRNSDYGAGCDGIGVTIPREVELPADLSSDWAASHSACIPNARLIAVCLGDAVAADFVIGCTFQVAAGQAAVTLTCDRLSLMTPEDRYAPNLELSEVLGQGSVETSRPCVEPTELATGTSIAAAFVVPASEAAGDLAVLVDVDGSEVPAFLIPAGQMMASPDA